LLLFTRSTRKSQGQLRAGLGAREGDGVDGRGVAGVAPCRRLVLE